MAFIHDIMFKQHFFADVVFGLLDMVLLSTRLSSSTTGGVEMLLNFSIVVVDDPDETSATFAMITSGLSEVDIVAAGLPTRSNLESRGVPIASVMCPPYDNATENEDHCLLYCPHVVKDRFLIWIVIGLTRFYVGFFNANLEDVTSTREEDIFPSIQRLSKMWIAARFSKGIAAWDKWISSPYDILALG
ncbi:hypothetical protein Tco_1260871 [Tanacetum coccineum]